MSEQQTSEQLTEAEAHELEEKLKSFFARGLAAGFMLGVLFTIALVVGVT